MSFKNTQLCGGEDDEDREYKEWQAQQFFEKTAPKVLEENAKFLNDVMEIPKQDTNNEMHTIQQMNNVNFESSNKLQTADHTAYCCSSDVPLVNNLNRKQDDEDDDNSSNASKIISSFAQAANGTSMLDHLVNNILAQNVNDPYVNEDNMTQHGLSSDVSY